MSIGCGMDGWVPAVLHETGTLPRNGRIMALHLRKLVAAAIAVSSLFAFSAPSLAQATSSTSQAAHRHHSAKHHHRHHRAIPQHNGGDHDADNNGGPSDGDGNI